jgi:hypothetical protein
LQTDQDRGKVEVGVGMLKMVIREVYARSHGLALGVLRISASVVLLLHLSQFSFIT